MKNAGHVARSLVRGSPWYEAWTNGNMALMPLVIRFPVAAKRPTTMRIRYFCHMG